MSKMLQILKPLQATTDKLDQNHLDNFITQTLRKLHTKGEPRQTHTGREIVDLLHPYLWVQFKTDNHRLLPNNSPGGSNTGT